MANKKKEEIMYVFDLNKMIEFIMSNNFNDGTNSEIIDSYSLIDNKMTLASKNVRESKDNTSQTVESAIRYELVKYLLNGLGEITLNENDEINNFADKMIVNTLFNEEFIKIIKNN